MSLEDVEKTVLASAEAEAKQILDEAEAAAKAELGRRSAALRDQQRRQIDQARADADAGYERDVNLRRAEHGMRVLEAKNAVIDAIFDTARRRILASQGFDYSLWLAEQVRRACEKASGTLHCNERDRETVEAVARDAGTDETEVEVDNAIDGGVLLVAEGFDLDLTLGSMLADLRTELTVSIAERLFTDLPALGETP